MNYENILIETKGKVGIITFNRPKALNALNSALITELNNALSAYEENADIGAIILTGSEKAFAAGADIREMKDKTFEQVTSQNFLEPFRGGVQALGPGLQFFLVLAEIFGVRSGNVDLVCHGGHST